MIVYGPVPSRRLGQSLGINHIPPKTCSYSCCYCQLGRTDKMQIARRGFYSPEEIFLEVEQKLKQVNASGKVVDYLSFVPDGEPTLDINLGTEIALLKRLNIKIAVITNASLLWMEDVREDLLRADWVSVKFDAADEETWRLIDRPYGALKLQKILNGIEEFAKMFKGTLVTETMLVNGLNDSLSNLENIAGKLADIKPEKAFLLVPTRPPAEPNVIRASNEKLLEAARLIRRLAGIPVEWITGDEQEDGFFFTGNIADDLLSITAVHPLKADIVDEILNKQETDRGIADRSIIEKLVECGELLEFWHEGKKFYRKNIQGNHEKK